MVVYDVEPEALGKPGGNILAEGAHFARHRYNGHAGLLGPMP
jgi:hypothetical protein